MLGNKFAQGGHKRFQGGQCPASPVSSYGPAGGCRISVPAAAGHFCVCRMAYFWTCGGYELACRPDDTNCPGNCYSVECCKHALQYRWTEGPLDCGGYPKN